MGTRDAWQPPDDDRAEPPAVRKEPSDDDLEWDDTHLEGSSRASQRSRLVISPEDTKRIAWDFFQMVFILYESILVPYRLCFKQDASGLLEVLEDALYIFFLLDIALNFFTGVYISGHLVMSVRGIAPYYLRTWFPLDLAASFPYEWVFEASTLEGVQLLRMIKFARLLRVIRLLRVLKLKRIISKVEEYINSEVLSVLIQLLRLVTFVVFIAHWVACVWYALADTDPTTRFSWLDRFDYRDAPPWDQYIAAMYWSFATMTTVGYGDIYPVNSVEQVFGVVTMLLACGVFAFFVGAIGSVVRKLDANAAAFRAKKKAVNQYFRQRRLPKPLQVRVRRYLEFVWEYGKDANLEEGEVMSILSPPLRTEIMVHLVGGVIRSAPFFTNIPLSMLKKICQVVTRETHAPGDIIFEEGEWASSMYFVIKGKVKLLSRSHGGATIGYLSEGGYFGEVALFMETSRSASAKCLSFCDTICLSRQSLLDLLVIYPKFRLKYDSLCREVLSGDVRGLCLQCVHCGKIGHLSDMCQAYTNVMKAAEAFKRGTSGPFTPAKARPTVFGSANSATTLDSKLKSRVTRVLIRAKTAGAIPVSPVSEGRTPTRSEPEESGGLGLDATPVPGQLPR
ncbi:hypothetical protein FOZ63_023821 [Perkinsus olseni]|uniref:Cyclic nucleotide-binding domain-containing protein n=2 Tax=Perkinsus olseni TaxID=32597 RepID=A0A7J6SAL0_PEROL|nr:hypothetical protein FOZ63_023821 [Perkinsus olseni]